MNNKIRKNSFFYIKLKKKSRKFRFIIAYYFLNFIFILKKIILKYRSLFKKSISNFFYKQRFKLYKINFKILRIFLYTFKIFVIFIKNRNYNNEYIFSFIINFIFILKYLIFKFLSKFIFNKFIFNFRTRFITSVFFFYFFFF